MAGGGTGGHVMPLLAVARELKSRGHEVRFIGTRQGFEGRIVPDSGFPIDWIEIGGLQRVGLAKSLKAAAQLPVSLWRSAQLLSGFAPAAVFSLGGYVAAPVVAAAAWKRIPVVAMEPNAIPGMVTRRFARWTAKALTAFPETSRYFPEGRSEVTGVPVREQFFELPAKAPGAVLTVLITGGSRGSRTLNNAFRESWSLFKEAQMPVRFLHQCGREGHQELSAQFAATGLDGEVTPFIADMPSAFAQADLIIGRSGAGAVAEIAAAGKASILVPFPFAADNHQQKNAEALVNAGAARMVLDRDMNGRQLFEQVSAFIKDRDSLTNLGLAARRLAKPGAAARAAEVLELVGRGARNRVDSTGSKPEE